MVHLHSENIKAIMENLELKRTPALNGLVKITRSRLVSTDRGHVPSVTRSALHTMYWLGATFEWAPGAQTLSDC
jgi:hypothetical protein